jgi:UDP-N-acetylmuramate--alanine ligase
LAKADLAYIMPIFASARENKDSFSISSKDIELSGIKNGIQNVKSCSTVGELISHLKNEISAGDVILTMGAGDVYKLADDIIDTVKTIKD